MFENFELKQVQAAGGYFFLVSLLSAQHFWFSVLASMLDGLARLEKLRGHAGLQGKARVVGPQMNMRPL